MRRALGKGLAQLLAEPTGVSVDVNPSEVSVDAIVPNTRQPRSHFGKEGLSELAKSIKEVGVLQPLLVRPIGEGKYELIAGERRWRAAKQAGLRSIPVIVRRASAEVSLEMALIENIQREDIGPLECARAYKRLIDEFGLTQERIADKVGKSRVAITNTLRLLQLPTEIQEGLEANLISEGHARAILMADTPIQQLNAYHRIVDQGTSVRELEKWVRELKTPLTNGSKEVSKSKRNSQTKQSQLNGNIAALENALSMYFGTPVQIQKLGKGGRLIVDFYSDEDLQRILDTLGVSL